MRALISVPVFSSPQESFGNAWGEIDLAQLRNDKETFAWPPEWISEHPNYFWSKHALASVSELDGRPYVKLYGIVCESVADARIFADFLESRAGLFSISMTTMVHEKPNMSFDTDAELVSL